MRESTEKHSSNWNCVRMTGKLNKICQKFIARNLYEAAILSDGPQLTINQEDALSLSTFDARTID